MAITACPFCFRKIDSSRLAYQCAGRGNIECKKSEDEARVKLTGSRLETFPTFLPDSKGGSHRRGTGHGSRQLPDLRRPGQAQSLPGVSHGAADRLRRLQEPDDRPGRR